nr:unnamed protein product [Callosobruchus chinensis]
MDLHQVTANSIDYLTQLLHGQLHNRTQQAKEDLTKFAYEVQSSAKQAFVNSLIETQVYVAANQFVEGIVDLGVQRIEPIQPQNCTGCCGNNLFGYLIALVF